MYYRIEVEIEARSPILVGGGLKSREVIKSKPYIPGSMIRGAVGAILAARECRYDEIPAAHDECEHREECLYHRAVGPENSTSAVQFHNAYKICGRHRRRSLPLPSFWNRCKVCGKYVSMLRELASLAGRPSPPLCPEDGGPLEEARGFACFENGVEEIAAEFRRITRTGVEMERFTAKEGALHTIVAIAEGQTFGTHISLFPRVGDRELTSDDAKKFIECIREISEEGIGGAKTRGMGMVEVKADLKEVKDDDLNREAKDILHALERSADLFGKPRAVAWLASPLPSEKPGRMEAGLLATYMQRARSIVFRPSEQFKPEVKLDLVLARGTDTGGFSLHGRPKPIYSAFDGGSSFLITIPNDEITAQCLCALRHHNSGKYKSHGCGEMHVEVIS